MERNLICARIAARRDEALGYTTDSVVEKVEELGSDEEHKIIFRTEG